MGHIIQLQMGQASQMGQTSQLKDIGLGFDALGAVNSAVAGFGQYESGQQQKAAYDYNADVTLQKSQQQMQTTEANYSNLIGKQATAYAASGVDIASGSPLLVMSHTAGQGGKEQASESEAGSEEAALQRYYGKVAAFSGTVGGISTFLSGLTKAGMNAAQTLGT
jgi:hypothetical protein